MIFSRYKAYLCLTKGIHHMPTALLNTKTDTLSDACLSACALSLLCTFVSKILRHYRSADDRHDITYSIRYIQLINPRSDIHAHADLRF